MLFRLALLCLLLLARGAFAEPPAVFVLLVHDRGTGAARETFKAEFRSDGTIGLMACRGNRASGCAFMEHGYQKGALAGVDAAARASGLASRPARPRGRRSDGDRIWGYVTTAEGEIRLPPQPRRRDARRVALMADAIAAAIPDGARAEIERRAAALTSKD